MIVACEINSAMLSVEVLGVDDFCSIDSIVLFTDTSLFVPLLSLLSLLLLLFCSPDCVINGRGEPSPGTVKRFVFSGSGTVDVKAAIAVKEDLFSNTMNEPLGVSRVGVGATVDPPEPTKRAFLTLFAFSLRCRFDSR